MTNETAKDELDEICDYLEAEFCLTDIEATMILYAAYFQQDVQNNPTISQFKRTAQAMALAMQDS